VVEQLKIVVLGAHPDDPESGCGGLAANCVKTGNEVIFAYVTAYREGRQFFERPEGEVRTEEARKACKVLGVRPVIWDFPHGGIDVNEKNTDLALDFLLGEMPDVVLAHWPIDTHYDHRCVATLALSAFLSPESDFKFYYFEVMTGLQSIKFNPTHYVDITDVVDIKRRALLCHRSQNPEKVWQDHELMHRFRGRECGVERAEAYLRLDRSNTSSPGLPGLIGSV
jgi:LmbE family N-acetylglucosaminyl deacetylase